MAGVGVENNTPRRRPLGPLLLAAAALLAISVSPAGAGPTDPAALPPVPAPGATAGPLDRPAPNEMVRDLAGVLTPEQTRTLRNRIRALRDDTGVQIYALVLDHIPGVQSGSVAAPNAPLAGFLQRLFVRMGDRHPLLQDADWSTGVVLALAPAQRRARVGFGPGWNDQTRRTAANLAPIYGAPDFRRGRYARGLNRLIDVTGTLMRGESLPPPPGAAWWRALWGAGCGGIAFAALGVWHRPTRRRTLSILRMLLALPHAALTRAAGHRASGSTRVYPPPPAGASSRW